MLWIVRVAVCVSLVLASVSKAHGGTFAETDGVATALITTPARSGKAEVETKERPALLGLRFNAGVAFIGPTTRGRRAVVGLGRPDLQPAVAAAEARGGLALIDEGPDSRAGLAYVVNKQVSLGLSYEHVTDETMTFEVAETGSLNGDYMSHNVFLQARWEF